MKSEIYSLEESILSSFIQIKRMDGEKETYTLLWSDIHTYVGPHPECDKEDAT